MLYNGAVFNDTAPFSYKNNTFLTIFLRIVKVGRFFDNGVLYSQLDNMRFKGGMICINLFGRNP